MIDPNPEQRLMTIPVCPVTGGCITRMTERGFREACDLIKESITDVQRVVPLCFQCDGYPPELTIIKLEDFKMVTKTKKCELCDERKTTIRSRGHDVCATCQKIMTDISKRNDLIDKARGWMGVGATDAEVDSQDDVIGEIAAILNSSGINLTEVAKARMDTIDRLQASLMDRENKILLLRETVDTLRDTVDTVATTGMEESLANSDMARKLALIQTVVGVVDPDVDPAAFVGDISALATTIVMGRTTPDRRSAA